MATSYVVSHSNGLREKGRISPLPYSNTFFEKQPLRTRPSQWTTTYSFQLPLSRRILRRRISIIVPLPHRILQSAMHRFGPKRTLMILLCTCLLLTWTLMGSGKRSQIPTHHQPWPSPITPSEPSTLVFGRADLQRVWEWEVLSGHYPSSRKIPQEINFTAPLLNPSIPQKQKAEMIPSRFGPSSSYITSTTGHGPKRRYLDIQSTPPEVSYPPRPVPGSVADLDIVMDNCDFSMNKYVRDCLEVLRVGAGLDNENRMRRGKVDDWRYIYVEEDRKLNQNPSKAVHQDKLPSKVETQLNPNAGLNFLKIGELEPRLQLSPPRTYKAYVEQPEACDSDYPRIFHMFWTGPFTDKPYLALLSFLFTQNLGLHLAPGTTRVNVCRPQFWLWINPGPAAMAHNPTAVKDMFESLARNPWSSPFLHPRFKGIIKFKVWNTTEQLDGVPEIKNDWRSSNLFNSGGYVFNVPKPETTSTIVEGGDTANATGMESTSTSSPGSSEEEDMLQRLGSTSQSSYDRLSVVLSDLARFVLCHRFGGIYLDADTIFLRDWEDLWGWKGAFAYRWSRLPKYNTAVLRLNKQSALGSFLFRTALRNGLDFHPMTIAQYTKDAHLEGLLLRLPDALFDSAWLNTEDYQRDRPPFPYFTEFANFFNTPVIDSAAPQALGFEGFFRGAYSYHFHNFWWEPFDSVRNWPDLGERFIQGETAARKTLYISKLNEALGIIPKGRSSTADDSKVLNPSEEDYMSDDNIEEDKRDLGWATVLKRTFEAYIRGERPNMYGEWIVW